MTKKNPADIESVLGAIDQVSETEFALNQTRELAASYRRKSFLEVVQNLKNEHRVVGKKFSEAVKRLELVSAADVRVALFKSHPDCKILDVSDRLIVIEAQYPRRVAQLKPPYGYKGGAARLVLSQSLGEPVWNYVPRDVDIVRIGIGSERTDWLVAKQFMPEDFAHGAGVEILSDEAEYFSTRDTTINEVLVIGSRVTCTVLCLEDFLNSVLAPTPHSMQSTGQVEGRTLAKLLRFQAISEIEGRPMRLERLGTIPEVQPFDIALHLDRALARSAKVAELYVKNCISYGLLTLDGDAPTIEAAKRKLAKRSPSTMKNLKTLKGRSPKKRFPPR